MCIIPGGVSRCAIIGDQDTPRGFARGGASTGMPCKGNAGKRGDEDLDGVWRTGLGGGDSPGSHPGSLSYCRLAVTAGVECLSLSLGDTAPSRDLPPFSLHPGIPRAITPSTKVCGKDRPDLQRRHSFERQAPKSARCAGFACRVRLPRRPSLLRSPKGRDLNDRVETILYRLLAYLRHGRDGSLAGGGSWSGRCGWGWWQ